MISEVINNLHKQLPDGVQLVAVSKFHPAEDIKLAYDAGQRRFGESRVQEILTKIPILPNDISWHFIGHLQTNKVNKIVGKVSMIESVDSEKLLNLIDKESAKIGVITNVLLQIHVAKEETKFGFLEQELFDFFTQRKFEALTNTHICGIMGMASNTDDKQRVTNDFKTIRAAFDKIRNEIAPDLRGFDTVSMGMSGDWTIAVQNGSTLVRIGSAIFGPRNY